MTDSQNLDLHGLTAELEAAIADLAVTGKLEQTGIVTKVADGVVTIYGLSEVGLTEIIDVETTRGTTVPAFVLNLTADEVGAVLMGAESEIAAGAKVTARGTLLEVPVGPELVGRVVDPLGRPLDDLGPIKTAKTSPIERPAIGVMGRKSVHEPLATGIIAIDTMVPIGRGQRQLIIGDRGTGKTALTIDTMINQARQSTGVVNVYVAIGQKLSKVAALVERLKREGVMEQTIIVATSPADPASLLYLAPYAATAMGEYFRDKGEHALMIYDDLSKHAVAYRQMSLLLRRPPGREAYPGDVFYLHSRLLERSAKLSDDLGAGSLTALPIIETQAGDIGAYIPTNVISITDGQIFLETSLFYQGIRPAISVGLSVSRVGGAAQTKATKSVAGALRLDLAQYRELAAFSQFASDLDDATKQRLTRGRVLTDLLKQRQYQPQSIADQVVLLTAANAGVFDTIAPKDLAATAELLRTEMTTKHKALVSSLNAGTKPNDDETKQMVTLGTTAAKTYEKEA